MKTGSRRIIPWPFLKEYWPWFFVVAALLAVFVRFMPAVYLSTLCSDNIQAALLFHDTVEQGHSAHGWIFGGHSDLVPDVSLIFLLELLLRNGIATLQVQNGIFFVTWVASLAVLHRLAGGRNTAIFASLVILFLMGCCRNFGIVHGLGFHDSFAMGIHSGTGFMALICLSLCLHVATKGGRAAYWWLFALCFATAASDALFLMLFSLPALVALLVARLRRPSEIGSVPPLAANILAATVLGNALARHLFPAIIVGGYTHYDPVLARQAWHAVCEALAPSKGGDFILFFTLDVLFVLVGLGMASGLLFKSAAKKIAAPVFLLLIFGACVIVTDWSAAILTGDFVSLAASRYVRFSLILPALVLLAWLNHRIPWSKPIAGIAVIVLSALAAGAAFFCAPQPGGYYTRARVLIPKMRSIMEKEHIEEGLADYWYANVITFLSHDSVRLRSVTASGALFHWLNNIAWYSGEPPGPAPKFRMIYMASLDPAQIRQRYGPPASIVPAGPGLADIWIYAPDKAISYNAIFGELNNDPAYSLPNEYHVAASALPSQTGSREGGSVVAQGGRDREGAMIYGSYIHLISGRYRIEIAYAWLNPPEPGREVACDAVLWKNAGPIILDQAQIPFTKRAPGVVTREVRISNQDHDASFEVRVFYRGSGDFRVDSLGITYLGP